MSFETIVKRSREINKALRELQKTLSDHKQYGKLISKHIRHLEKDLEFAKVRNGLREQEAIIYLQGYVPSEDAGKIAEAS
ncbi:MAG: hypothetical protein U5N26_11050 [Candidatus Marinimicrobia bacterium]|nr:hypothetical protein [Candidatus Neomarinimicrobiota bacterium]